MAITSVSSDLLVSITQARMAQLAARAGGTAFSSSSGSASTIKAPWENAKSITPASALVSNALSGRTIFDASARKFSAPGLSADARKLFALHSGVNTLAALAGRYGADGVSDSEKTRLEQAFAKGLKDLDAFLANVKFADLSMVRGALMNQAISKAVLAKAPTQYVTSIIARGDPSAANDAFSGDLAFTIDAIDADGVSIEVQIDLADMGATPRSLNGVVAFLNQKLAGAQLTSRFETALASAKASNGAEQYALKLNISAEEEFSFSATTTAPALYVAGGHNRLLKFQDTDASLAPPPLPGDPGWVAGRVYDKALEQGETRAAATGADGSIYVLADVTSATNQPLKGASDVALFKYDSAGKLVFSRTLGAADAAQGFALALAADGRIGVAGAVTGALAVITDPDTGAVETGSDATGADSFVTVFNQEGLELWAARDGAEDGDDEARALAFAADGSLYVGGRAKAALDGQGAAGGWDGYLRAYDGSGVLRSTAQFGGADDEGVGAIAVQDMGAGVQRITLAGDEAGKLVLRQFSDDGVALAAGASRDLGALGGGEIVGLALDGGDLYVAGNTKIGGLNAGSVAASYGGGQDGFVVRLAGDLTQGASDRISYVGGAKDDAIAGFAVLGGQVWLAGDSQATFAGQIAIGARDGFIARLDASGALAMTRRFTETDQDFAMSGFAFDPGGASALDRFGLPSGQIVLADTKALTARTSLRAGDEFSMSVNGRSAQKFVIAEDDTLETLAERIERVLLSDGAATVSLASGGDGLKIAASNGDQIRLIAGAEGRNALTGLGLSEGVIRPDPTGAAAKKKAKPSYGLGIGADISLSSKLDRKNAVDQFGVALSAIQKAYKTLTTPAAPAKTGPAPAYLQAQIANYQAALARLGG